MKLDKDQSMIDEVESGVAADRISASEQPEVSDNLVESAKDLDGEIGSDWNSTDEVEVLQAELEKSRDQLVRKVAEFQNYRRRTEQEKAILVDIGKGMVVQQLLDVVDDLERSLAVSAEADKDNTGGKDPFTGLRDGVNLVYRKFKDELSRLGVEHIEAVGQPFDEEQHEAMMQMPAPEGSEAGVVLQEIQKGYRMGDKVLRHARVIVAS